MESPEKWATIDICNFITSGPTNITFIFRAANLKYYEIIHRYY